MAGPMLPLVHTLKVWPEYFAPLSAGSKNFEFRKDDRTPRFEKGDFLHLREWNPEATLGDDEYGCLATFAPGYTGRSCFRHITYVARGGVIPSGYCCMALEVATEFQLASFEAIPTLYETSRPLAMKRDEGGTE